MAAKTFDDFRNPIRLLLNTEGDAPSAADKDVLADFAAGILFDLHRAANALETIAREAREISDSAARR